MYICLLLPGKEVAQRLDSHAVLVIALSASAVDDLESSNTHFSLATCYPSLKAGGAALYVVEE